MSRYLMVLWSGGGAVPPQLAVAKRLVRAGHGVTVLAPRSLEPAILATGANYEPYRRAPEHDASSPDLDLLRDWEVRGAAARARMRDNVMFGTAPAICADVLAVAEANPPDAVVTDYILLGAYVAAETAALPVAALMHSIFTLPRPGIPPFGPGFKLARGPLGRARDAVVRKRGTRFFSARLDELNALRRSYSLAPIRHPFASVLAADRLLILTSPAFDYPAPIPATARWAGAITDPDLPPPTQAGASQDGTPSVLVSFSTTFQGQAPVLLRVIKALEGLPVSAVVTCGPAVEPNQLPRASNVRVVKTAPHHELLPTTSLVITHAGHGTVSAALRHGVPVLCVPMGRDQREVAARAAWHGAGISAPPNSSSARFRRLIHTALDDPRYRTAARQLAARMATDDPDTAVRELEQLATTTDHTATTYPPRQPKQS